MSAFPPMKVAALLTALASLAPYAVAAEALYANDFEKAEAGKVPTELMLMSGDFAVKAEGGGKFLELPGSPLETFGLLFGPTEQTGLSASARIFGTKTGRKFPTFGVSLNGVAGYRLQVSPAKKALEIYKGDEAKGSVPFEWASGAWTQLRIQVRKGPGGWIVEGKAWPSESAEPAKWAITFDEKDEPPSGRAGLWGSPYSGTPIRFDDLTVAPAQP